MAKCRICDRGAFGTFALIPLCEEHHRAVFKETHRYYQDKISRSERLLYNRISKYIPWRNRT
jgi:hypothetical protein